MARNRVAGLESAIDFRPNSFEKTRALILVPLRDAPVEFAKISQNVRQVCGLELLKNQIRKTRAVAGARQTSTFKEKVGEQVRRDPDKPPAPQEETVFFQQIDRVRYFVRSNVENLRCWFNELLRGRC